ncbi:hypothetical protein SGPA1_50459 [Streptomyces misionensis JCM 4497]
MRLPEPCRADGSGPQPGAWVQRALPRALFAVVLINTTPRRYYCHTFAVRVRSMAERPTNAGSCAPPSASRSLNKGSA